MTTLKLILSFVMIVCILGMIIIAAKKMVSPWKWITIVSYLVCIIILILYIDLLLGRLA